MARAPKGPKQVANLTHDDTRRNIPTAELQSIAERMEEVEGPAPPLRVARARPLAEGEIRERDGDLDPQIIWNGVTIRLTKDQVAQLGASGKVEIGDAQLVWRGKDTQDWSDLVVNAPPLYIQEKIHPKVIIDDLKRRSRETAPAAESLDLFADFNGLTDPEARTEFYQHDQHWSNRMILGDSLQVMASLAQRESLKGQVQCIYFDPPYGIKFNSNWQVSTLSRDVKDGKQTDVSREPEQVKAFRDTWRDGTHSYLTYLRDRLTVMRELLTESGSIFVQIGDENVHRVRAVLDEVFGDTNCLATIPYATTGGTTGDFLPSTFNYVLQYARDRSSSKYRQLYLRKEYGGDGASGYNRIELPDGRRSAMADARKLGFDESSQEARVYSLDNLKSQSGGRAKGDGAACWTRVPFQGREFDPGSTATWKTHETGMIRLLAASRCEIAGNNLRYVRFIDDFPAFPLSDQWTDTTTFGFGKQYVVETSTKVVERCVLMATDPGDLVLDPTCGSGTTAYVAEQLGRRWITVDTSRVALALARTRLMSARYPYYFLKDSPEGRRKEQEITARIQPDGATFGDLRQGFVYERAPHVTLKSIANNSEIDTIWETWAARLDPLRAEMSALVGEADKIRPQMTQMNTDETVSSAPRTSVSSASSVDRDSSLEEWQLPREAPAAWPAEAKALLARWWEGRIARQREIDASIAKAADVEMLYDRPYVDTSRVRVAGPFTVESLSPHRVVPADEIELIDEVNAAEGRRGRGRLSSPPTDFAQMVLEHLKTAGVQQSTRGEKIDFTALAPWPGEYVGAEGRFMEGETERRAAVFIGPEFGTLSRPDLTAAAREAMDARFDVLIACAFNFDAHASDLARLGPLPILKAKMNPDLHMAGELKNTGKGNLFIVFGEPDIEILDEGDGEIAVKVKGVDVFDPNTGEVRSNDVKGIAAWFIDTDYNEESFFVRHAYFLGGNDPYRSLKTALKAEIDEDAWATLYRDVSRPFEKPKTGRIAVKVINHFGDEVMKVFRV